MGTETRYRFNEFELDVASRKLLRAGKRMALTPKAFAVLVELVNQPGAVIRKEEFLERVWPETHVGEGTLAQNISTLRKALGSAEAIEAVSKTGYRFTWEVEPVAVSPDRAPSRRPVVRILAWSLAAAAVLSSIALLIASRAKGPSREQQEAMALAREGYQLMRRSTQTDAIAAAERFEAALGKSPGMALAKAGLAEAFNRSGRASFEHARDLAREAVREDPACGECHGILGYILMTRDWQWEPAQKELQRAVALQNSDPQLHIWEAQWFAIHRQFAEARKEAEIAVQLDPARPGSLTMLAGVLYLSGNYQEAIHEAEKAVGLNPRHSSAYQWIYRAQLMLGHEQSAIEGRANETASWMQLSEESAAQVRVRLVALFHEGGRKAVVGSWLSEVDEGIARDLHRYERAVWRLWIGDRDGALDELEAAVAAKPFNLIYANSDPMFTPLRDTPRFQGVLRQVGLLN
jgi:DNA-binding winged helix-turn-helix (wHTH) protein/Flp pilus assembly protein TadD